jgi:ligand-binding sensor domain-containing protein
VGALDGLWLWDGASARRVGSDSGSLPSDWVTAIAADPTGVWAGTFDAGLARLSPAHRRFAPSDGLPDARIQPHALALSGALAYAGTPAGILELHDGSAALVTEGLPSAEVTALVPAPGGGLWMGHQGGAARIEIEEVLP